MAAAERVVDIPGVRCVEECHLLCGSLEHIWSSKGVGLIIAQDQRHILHLDIQLLHQHTIKVSECIR